MNRLLLALVTAAAFAAPARSLDLLQSTAVPWRQPSSFCASMPGGLAINRADGTLWYCDPSGNLKTRVLPDPGAPLQVGGVSSSGPVSGTTGTFSGPMSALTLEGDASEASSTVSGMGAVARRLKDKDTVSVLDFGAACDGTSDDSAAVRRALATGKSVFIPKGGKICVFGDIVLNGASQRIIGHGSVVRPARGASRLIQVSGYANGVEGLYVQDNGNLVAKTILSAPAASGATSITIGSVASGPAVQVGQRYSIRLNSGGWATGFVTAVSGSTVTLRDPLPSVASAGNTVWSTFGVVEATTGSRYTIRDIGGADIWGGIMVDAPSGSISKGYVDHVNFSAGIRMFGLVKGRNAADNTFSRMELWGGHYSTTTAAGNGLTTTFALPEQVNLTRELTVTVADATKTFGPDYTIAANGLSITFTTAPAAGAAISMGFQAYGHDGVVDDGRDSTSATGGNYYNAISSLQFRRCGWLKGAQLYAITNQSIFDACQDTALLVDGTSQIGSISAFVGWASGIGLHVTNNAAGLKSADIVLGTQPAGYSVSGTTPTPIAVDSGSSLTGRVHTTSAGFVDYAGGLAAHTVSSNGVETWSDNAEASTSIFAHWNWVGVGSGAATWGISTTGAVVGWSGCTFCYQTANSNNAIFTLQVNGLNAQSIRQATGAGGVIQDQAASTVKQTIGSTDILTTTANVIIAAKPIMLPVSTVATLPSCNPSLRGAMSYVTDAVSPTYNAAVTGGGTIGVPVACSGTKWTAH